MSEMTPSSISDFQEVNVRQAFTLKVVQNGPIQLRECPHLNWITIENGGYRKLSNSQRLLSYVDVLSSANFIVHFGYVCENTCL